MLYKLYDTKWSVIAKYFPDKSPSSIKNKFYTILKRVATQAQLENPDKYPITMVKCKTNLVQFVDCAIEHEHEIPSKKGRKRKTDWIFAEENAILFPSSAKPEEPQSPNPPPYPKKSEANSNYEQTMNPPYYWQIPFIQPPMGISNLPWNQMIQPIGTACYLNGMPQTFGK